MTPTNLVQLGTVLCIIAVVSGAWGATLAESGDGGGIYIAASVILLVVGGTAALVGRLTE